jgi:hypothetical protein
MSELPTAPSWTFVLMALWWAICAFFLGVAIP